MDNGLSWVFIIAIGIGVIIKLVTGHENTRNDGGGYFDYDTNSDSYDDSNSYSDGSCDGGGGGGD